MAMNVELYDNLRGEIGDKAARVIAEAIPPGDRLATNDEMKHGFDQIRSEMQAGADQIRSEMQAGFAQIRSEMQAGADQIRSEMQAGFHRSEARTMRWMLSFFVPLWIGVYGTLAAVVITLIVRG